MTDRTYDAVPVPALDAYYDQTRKEYLVQDNQNGWVSINETALKRIMRQRGFDTRPRRGDLVSEVDAKIIDVQTRFNVQYAGPVAGYHTGLYNTPDARFLVTKSPTIVQAVPGPWDKLRGILEGMVGTQQLVYLYGWLKCARASLISRKFTPGQALAFAGPRDSGKSLFQNLITPALGGRVARPYQFMSGQTPFNAHLFGAEHLMIEDESPLTDHKARRALGAMVKSITVNVDQSCHRKGATPIMLRPFWRLTMTLNDEPENLMVLPPMDESIEDKLILLKADKCPMPMPTATPEERAEFWRVLLEELPGFLAHVETFVIPPTLVSQRFGIAHYHHPELLARLDDLAPESKLLGIIDGHIRQDGQAWVGRSADLERVITSVNAPYRDEARRLLSWTNACGTYLGRLRRRYPDRITCRQVGEERERIWTILPPWGTP